MTTIVAEFESFGVVDPRCEHEMRAIRAHRWGKAFRQNLNVSFCVRPVRVCEGHCEYVAIEDGEGFAWSFDSSDCEGGCQECPDADAAELIAAFGLPETSEDSISPPCKVLE